MTNKVYNIGIIGYNEGNGHPYSFSAIINGYDSGHMQNCPYPVIYNYLSKRSADDFGVPNLKVTHVWSPYDDISKSISECCYIDTICTHYEEMLDKVDAVIIARDDASSHRIIAEKFLERGIKVFIDKPLCDNKDDLSFFLPFIKNGLLFTASGLRFHPEILNRDKSQYFSSIISAHAIIPVEWIKYGVHALEPLSLIFGSTIKSVQNFGCENYDLVKVVFDDNRYAIVERNPNIMNGILIDLYTSSSEKFFLHFIDNFTYFKNLLFAFRAFIDNQYDDITDISVDNLIKALIAGKESLVSGNKKILVSEP